MKKSLLYLLILICSVGLFTACSDDDDPVQYIEDGECDGVYLGTLDVDAGIMGTKTGIPQKVYISKTGENLIKMELRDFSFESIPLGTIELDHIALIKKGNKCTFTGTGDLTLAVGNCGLVINGTIEGKNLNMNIEVTAKDLNNLKVNVNFNGTKLAADKSSKAEMKNFTINSELVVKEPVMNGTTISFIVVDNITDEQLASLAPEFEISAGATVDKASGSPQNFKNPVVYTVTSEDGIVTTKYTVTAIVGKALVFDFDEWKDVDDNNGGTFPFPVGTWGGTNEGMAYMNVTAAGVGLPAFGFPVTSVEGVDGVGKAAMLKTYHTAMTLSGMDINSELGFPYVTAGSLFTGTFKTDVKDFLNSTKFGISYQQGKPLMFQGYYKYTPGETYYTADNQVAEGVTDKCSVYAILYEEELGEDGVNIPLTGHDVTTSDRIVLRAVAADGSAQSEWKEFSVPFEQVGDKVYDSTKKYYLAVICASSDKGDTYNGADGSTLIVDNFRIIAE